MKKLVQKLFIGSLFVAAALVSTDSALAQQNPFRPSFNTTVQLPVLRFFNIRTVVSAPDGGMTYAGGVKRHASGSRSSGIPGLAGRPFTNRASGFDASGGSLVIKPTIIITSELEEDVMAEANRREALRSFSDPDGAPSVQRKADFITRNIGRNRK